MGGRCIVSAGVVHEVCIWWQENWRSYSTALLLTETRMLGVDLGVLLPMTAQSFGGFPSSGTALGSVNPNLGVVVR